MTLILASQLFSSPEQRRRFVVHSLLAIGALALLWAVIAPHVETLRDPGVVRRTVREFGSAAVIAYVALLVVQILVVPIPGQVIAIAGGYLFGALPGIVYTMAGVTLGSYVAFAVARRFGRPYIESVFATDVVERFDVTVSKMGITGITALVLVPGLPDDVVCFVCGISDLTTRQFLLIAVLGRTPAFALAVLTGAEFGDEQTLRGVALLLLLAVFTAVGYLERERLRRALVERFGD